MSDGNVAQMPKLRTGGAIAAIIPQTIEEIFRLATAVSKSGLAPNGMNTPEKLMVAIMHGMEIGLPPMQAIQRIAVVNGRPTIWGDAIPALLQSRGFRLIETISGEGDDRTANCTVVRPDGSRNSAGFSVADAKKAGLWAKVGPWKQYPDRMLQMRARGYAARDGAADVLAGLYLREEIEDEFATAPKSAHRARKDGDYERLIADLKACTTPEAIDTFLANNSELIDKIPRSWVEHLNEAVTTHRAKLAAPTVEPIEDTPESETEEARRMIRQAVSLDMLAHLRDAYADADWAELESDYDNKAVELGAS